MPTTGDRDPILIIDDNADLRSSLAALLELHDYSVVQAENGEEGLAKLHEGLSPCLILLDLHMPTMNGYEFRAEQQANSGLSEIPTVIVSAVNSPAELEGIAASLPKPLDFGELFRIIDRYCGRGIRKRVCRSQGVGNGTRNKIRPPRA
jgi:CheY-like chemotaxis protein